jgi:hypothetical protein
MLVGGCVLSRLLARVLKEGVQFWYNGTSTVKMGGGGSRKRSSGKPLKFNSLCYFMAVSVPSSFEIFQTH